MEIHARNVNEAFSEVWWKLQVSGIREGSRNGPVIVMPGPVTTIYSQPTERILWNPRRDANHAFHLMEALWMLTGSNNVKWLSQFNSRMSSYAESDGHLHGAYGFRWRTAFGIDQLRSAVQTLKESANTRRAVISMWDPSRDLGTDYRDIPCNTTIYLDRRFGALNMTVCCRSNDILWGAYGANVVHFSVLQEVLAHAVGVPVGMYYQFSNNFHAYMETARQFITSPVAGDTEDLYLRDQRPTPLLLPGERWLDFINDCDALVAGSVNAKTQFIQTIAMPMRDCYLARKRKAPYDVTKIAPSDWATAFQMWLERREEKAHDGE